MPPKLPTTATVLNQATTDTQGSLATASPEMATTVTRPNGVSVTHQPGGDWVVSNYEQVIAIASDPAGGYYGQCVALVKQLTGMPATRDWRAEDAITGYGAPPLQPGTVIATMDENGRYAQGNVPKHAAVFVKYEMRGNQAGMVIYDQYKNKDGTIKPPGARWIAFTGNKKHPQNDAGAYSVVTAR